MENPTTNNTPAEEEVKQEVSTTQAAADGEERKMGEGEENKGEGKSSQSIIPTSMHLLCLYNHTPVYFKFWLVHFYMFRRGS